MKRINVAYWICTGLLVPTLGIGSVMELAGAPESVEAITSLDFPAYLSPFLGVARLSALVVILTPRYPRLKEWAYAGLVFDATVAIYAQIAVGNPLTHTIFPVMLLGVVFSSYYFHHRRRSIYNTSPLT